MQRDYHNLNKRLSHASGADDRATDEHKQKSVAHFTLECSDGVVGLEAKVPLSEVKDLVVRATRRVLPVVVPSILTLATITGIVQVHHPDLSPSPIPHQVNIKQ